MHVGKAEAFQARHDRMSLIQSRGDFISMTMLDSNCPRWGSFRGVLFGKFLFSQKALQ